MNLLNEYRKRRTKFRVVTLPKSGTYFLVELLPKLGIKKKKISHVLNSENKPALKFNQKAIMTIRDPRGFFVSLTHWCDIQGQRILAGADPVALYMNMMPQNVHEWQTYGFDEKLKYLITEDSRALFFTWLIRPYFDCVCANMKNSLLKTVRFEDMMAWKEDGPSDVQVATVDGMTRYFNITIPEKEIFAALKLSRGKSPTFFQGKPAGWQDEINEENSKLIQERWGQYIADWGYRI